MTARRRAEIVADALGSVRAEGLEPSPPVLLVTRWFAAGKVELEDVLEFTLTYARARREGTL